MLLCLYNIKDFNLYSGLRNKIFEDLYGQVIVKQKRPSVTGYKCLCLLKQLFFFASTANHIPDFMQHKLCWLLSISII